MLFDLGIAIRARQGKLARAVLANGLSHRRSSRALLVLITNRVDGASAGDIVSLSCAVLAVRGSTLCGVARLFGAFCGAQPASCIMRASSTLSSRRPPARGARPALSSRKYVSAWYREIREKANQPKARALCILRAHGAALIFFFARAW